MPTGEITAVGPSARKVGAELFVMDDGWFGARRDDTAGLGDWTPHPAAFPNGLTPLITEVHRLGMRFRFRIAMAGALGIGGDLSRWSSEEITEAAEFVTLYKEIRPTVHNGLQYWLRAAVLLTHGLPLDLPPGDHASALIRLRVV
jgi:alpha-galactosidase